MSADGSSLSHDVGVWIDWVEDAGGDVTGLRCWLAGGLSVTAGDGYGDGCGCGEGEGEGDEAGYGYGNGGTGAGNGDGKGSGAGSGDGSGDGYGNGYDKYIEILLIYTCETVTEATLRVLTEHI